MKDRRTFLFPGAPDISRIKRGTLTSIRLFRSWDVLVSEMTDEEAGKSLKQLFEYMKTGKFHDDENLSQIGKAFLLMAIRSIEDSIDREIGKAVVYRSSGKATPIDTKEELKTEEENNG